MPARLREWLRRYGPAEAASVVATLGGVWSARASGAGPVAAALVGTWAGNIAYFGWILTADIRHARRVRRAQAGAYGWADVGRNLRALAIEFGPAEVFDSFFIRPALLLWLPRLTGSVGWGSLAAKLLADVTFYIPTVISYELSRRRRLRR